MECVWGCVGHGLCVYFEGRRRHDEGCGWHTRDKIWTWHVIGKECRSSEEWVDTRLSVRSSHDDLLGGMVNISLRGQSNGEICWLGSDTASDTDADAGPAEKMVLLAMANAHSQKKRDARQHECVFKILFQVCSSRFIHNRGVETNRGKEFFGAIILAGNNSSILWMRATRVHSAPSTWLFFPRGISRVALSIVK